MPFIKKLFFIPLLSVISACAIAQECAPCRRVEQFDKMREELDKKYWPGFATPKYKAPLFYLTATETYVLEPTPKIAKHYPGKPVKCINGRTLYVLDKRADSLKFHMENRTDISDRESPLYRSPAMFCSDVETANKLIPDVKHTEEWLALVMHEYFHAFQLKHKTMMDFLADSLRSSADTLNRIYFKYDWFKKDVHAENDLLLKAINTTYADSTRLYVTDFFAVRERRKAKFREVLGYDISRQENFWEKMEGPARYAEYHLAYLFADAEPRTTYSCDKFFGNYKDYKSGEMFNTDWMISKTKVESPYYYPLGFNMCRLLDKMNVRYKDNLFDHNVALVEILEREFRKTKK